MTKIKITTQAIEQIKLMLEHDYTLEDKVLRISIDGKGCDGFDYAIGFTDQNEKDFIHKVSGISLHLDPFVSEHLYDFSIDYQANYEREEEGFVITNNESDKTKGKFWLKSQKSS